MIRTYSLKTQAQGMYLITAKVQEAVEASGVTDGICVVWCPHTTAAITINENADPDVTEDLLFGLGKAFPDRPEFRHFEGNSSAHLKASCVGCNQTIIIENGRLHLGTWQGIWFCEFDGPRSRRFEVQVVGS
ncbi:MAG: secondary thiamine-phosphate synthase enzyme YjbQ [Sphaerochaetaceae bacterium]|jgi:secondary thiamine-phosphate synthase enzyme